MLVSGSLRWQREPSDPSLLQRNQNMDPKWDRCHTRWYFLEGLQVSNQTQVSLSKEAIPFCGTKHHIGQRIGLALGTVWGSYMQTHFEALGLGTRWNVGLGCRGGSPFGDLLFQLQCHWQGTGPNRLLKIDLAYHEWAGYCQIFLSHGRIHEVEMVKLILWCKT